MGGSPSNTRQTTVQEPSKFMKPYLSDLYQTSSSVAGTPYRRFKGDRIEGFNSEERQAQEGIQSLYDAGPRPELAWGAGQTAQSAGIAKQAAGIGQDVSQQDVRQWDQSAFDQYSSPYFENVMNIQKRNARDEALKMQQHLSAQQAFQGTGGYGSMRHGVQEAELMSNTQQTLADIDAKGRQQAWENSLAAFQGDRDATLEGGKLNLMGGELMLSGGDAMQNAASQSMDFADIQQSQAMQRIAALETSGMNQREMQQAIKDMAYSDFVERRDWRQNQQSWLASILGGFPIPMNSSQTMSSPGPSVAGQIGGAAALGIGAYNMYNS